MSVRFRIFPVRNLVLVRMDGIACPEEARRTYEAYLTHPDFRPGQKHLVDVSGVREVEANALGALKLDLRKVEAHIGKEEQTLLAYIAPNPPGFKLAVAASRAWNALPNVVAVVHQNEADALAFLGVDDARLDDLWDATAPV